MPRLFPLALVLLSLASRVAAGGVHVVPDDFGSVQEAIDAAAPGDVIVVRGGTHGPITIDRELTILGEPAPLFVGNGVAADPSTALAPITLAGPGSGTVVLGDVQVGGDVNGFQFPFAQAGIRGGGFRELHVYNSTVEGPRWVFLSGVAAGAPALDVTVDFVLISGSNVTGALSGNDDCYGNGPNGPTGLDAADSDVVVLDSNITGGGSHRICMYGICPWTGGRGGTGILARDLYHSDSTITGGVGAEYYDNVYDPPFLCGQAQDGVPFLGESETSFSSTLEAQTALRIGEEWTLYWNTGESILAVFHELELEPIQLRGAPVFIDFGNQGVLSFHAAGSQYSFVPIPDDASLIGLRITAQVYELGVGPSGPVVDVIRR